MFTSRTKLVSPTVPLIYLAALIGLSGCHLSPKYVQPQVPSPPAYKELTGDELKSVTWQNAQPSDTSLRSDWWLLFNESPLNALEAKVDISNQNIAVAAANYHAAGAIVRETKSAFFPAATIGASVANNRVSVVPAINLKSGVTYTEYELPVTASWEPDLWGKVRNNVRTATFQAQADAATLENVRLVEHVQVAMNYFLIQAQDSLAEVLDSSVQADRDTLDITRSLFHAGLTTDEALSAAEAQLAATQAQRDNIRIARAQYEHALALLVGVPATGFSVPPGVLPNSVPDIPTGVPARLLQRRPDISAAERSVAAANAQIGVARSAYFPDIILSGTFGFTSLGPSSWLNWPSRVWAVGPNFTEAIFDAGLRRATVQEYRSRYEATVASYQQTTLTAFQQVEDNLASLRVLRGEIEQQKRAVSAAQRVFDEATTRYRAGLDPYLNVVQAQQTLLTYRQGLVVLRSQQLMSTLNLILALGGGWDTKQLPDTRQVARTPSP